MGYLGAWGQDGDTTCGRFAPCRVLLTLTELVSSLGNIPLAGWKYHQLVSFFNKIKLLLRSLNSLTIFEKQCEQLSDARHLLSQMYRVILSGQDGTVPYFVREWERELDQILRNTQIEKMIKLTYSTSISSRVQEMAYKFPTRR